MCRYLLPRLSQPPSRTVMAIIGVLLLGAVLLIGCGQPAANAGSAPSQGTPSPVAPAQLPLNFTHTASLPPEHADPITQLVGDPSGAGAWFWDNTATGDTIYHVSATGTLTAYPVSNLGGQARDGFAISTSGMVWFGVNTTLIELDSQTGKIQTWTIPAFRANTKQQPTGSQYPQNARAVDDLAVGPSGQVTIAMQGQISVVEFDPSTANFSSLPLPQATDKALSVTYSSDGSLCVGMANLATGGHSDELFLVQPNGVTAQVTVPDGTAWEVGPYSASIFIVGSFDPHLVTSSGVVTKVQAPAALHGSAAAPTPLVVLPNGRLLGLAGHALIEFPSHAASVTAATTSASLLTAPKVPCHTETMTDGGTIPEPTPTPFPPGAMCPGPMSDILALDGAGNVWAVSPYVVGVSMLTASTLP